MDPYVTNADGSPVKMRAGMKFLYSAGSKTLRIQDEDGMQLQFSDGSSKCSFTGGREQLLLFIRLIASLTGFDWRTVKMTGEGNLGFELVWREAEEGADITPYLD